MTCEQVCSYFLVWSFRYRMRLYWLSWIIELISGTCLTFGHCNCDVLIYSRPIHDFTSSFFTLLNSQMAFMDFVQHLMSQIFQNHYFISFIQNSITNRQFRLAVPKFMNFYNTILLHFWPTIHDIMFHLSV